MDNGGVMLSEEGEVLFALSDLHFSKPPAWPERHPPVWSRLEGSLLCCDSAGRGAPFLSAMFSRGSQEPCAHHSLTVLAFIPESHCAFLVSQRQGQQKGEHCTQNSNMETVE